MNKGAVGGFVLLLECVHLIFPPQEIKSGVRHKPVDLQTIPSPRSVSPDQTSSASVHSAPPEPSGESLVFWKPFVVVKKIIVIISILTKNSNKIIIL